MKTHYDVIIVGGGIIGSAAAYYLTQTKHKKVLLLERNTLNSGTTSQAASLLIHSRPNQVLADMVQETFTSITKLQHDLDDTLGYNPVGCLHIGVSEQAKADVKQAADVAENFDVEVEHLDRKAALNKSPWLQLPADAAISFIPEDGYIDSYLLASAYVRQARIQGLIIQQGVSVNEILTDGQGQATGVQCDNEQTIYADKVVLAGGPWCSLLAAKLGSNLPVAPVRSQYWITQPHPDFSPLSPLTLLPDAKAYTRPEVGGLLFGLRDEQGVHASPADLPNDIHGFSFGSDNGWESLMAGFEPLAKFIPKLNDLSIDHYIGGVSSYTPDGRYIIGELPSVKGVFVATGCCGAGIAMSSGFGRLVAELVNEKPTFTRIDTFNPARFPEADPFNPIFREQCANARSRKK